MAQPTDLGAHAGGFKVRFSFEGFLPVKEARQYMTALISELQPRSGPRPLTQREIPHRQLTQGSPPEIQLALRERLINLPNVGEGESRIATLGTCAIWLKESMAHGPAEAFIDDHEFCHLHEDGFIHVSLPKSVCSSVIRLGWGEVHPSAEAGFLPETWMMVYAPRNAEELSVVMSFVAISHGFASGTVIDQP
jgi:hypothetical protein